MWFLKRGWWLQLLQFIAVLGSLWMLSLLIPLKTGRRPAYILRYQWLEYTNIDESPEKVCNCSAILQGEKEALLKAKLLTITKDFQKIIQIPDEYYINATQNCRKFQTSRKYITFPLSKEEEEFPLAYSMVVHHKVCFFSNFAVVKLGIDKIHNTVDVVYAGWTRVQADLNCMADLHNTSTTWKYFINLCGQDFPLKTNLEIVQALRSLKGGNSLESEEMPQGKKKRVMNAYQVVDGKVQPIGKTKDPAPFNLPILSGNAYIVVNRGYIRSVLEDERIQALTKWAKDTYSPDEFLWATIQRIPGVPGSTWPNSKFDITDMNAIARIVKWQGHEGSEGSLQAVYPECKGHHIRSICVYGAGDLQWLIEQHHLFANKFDADRSHCYLMLGEISETQGTD
uniref:Glucosaminyl (N-acetyl) transferase 3, mucin type n=1 Tax=Neolamprologus brichardi TaxID=32507 RepID=A0A3Q4H6U9_NEOBR